MLTDVGVRDGLIAAVGDLSAAEALEVVDGAGAMLCPGLIDLHAHSALVSFSDPLHTPKILQGFTTEVINPDGLAPAPVAPGGQAARQAYLRALEGEGPPEWPWTTLAEYLDALERSRPAVSLVPSVGHGAVREAVLGADRVAPSAAQLAEMRSLVRLGLEAGARMLSFGLVYIPGAYAETDELVAVAEEAAAFGVPLVPHVRNEGEGLLEAVGELIDVARRSGAPLHLSHLKSLSGDHLIEPLLTLIDAAAGDIDLTFDQYPYGAGRDAARKPASRLGSGGRRRDDPRARTRHPGARGDRPRHSGRPAGLGEHPRHARARPDRRRRKHADRDRRRARGRSGRGRPRPARREQPLGRDGPALRLRRGGSHDRGSSAPARRLGRDLRGEPASAAVRHGSQIPGPIRHSRGADPGRGGRCPAHGPRCRSPRPPGPRPDRGGEAGRPRAARPRSSTWIPPPTPTRSRARRECCGVWVAGQAVVRDGVPTGARPGGVATFVG